MLKLRSILKEHAVRGLDPNYVGKREEALMEQRRAIMRDTRLTTVVLGSANGPQIEARLDSEQRCFFPVFEVD